MTSNECVELLKWATERFDKRRSYEWKIILGFWGAIMVVAYQGPLVPLSAWIVAWAFFLLFWVRGVRVANENDKKLQQHYRKLIREGTYQVSPAKPEPEKIALSEPEWWFCTFDWNGCFQMGATAGIMVTAYFAARLRDEPLPYCANWDFCVTAFLLGVLVGLCLALAARVWLRYRKPTASETAEHNSTNAQPTSSAES